MATTKVTTGGITDATIATADIADDAVTAAKLASGAADLLADTTPQLGGNLDTNSFEISFDDNHSAIFGDGSDLKILHTGSESRIDFTNTAHNLKLMGSGGSSAIELNPRHDHNSVKAIANGAVELYHDNTKMIETTSTGTSMPDGKFAKFGASDDLTMGHNTYNYITYTGADFLITGDNTNHVKICPRSDETAAVFKPNDAVELYFDATKRFETESNGATTTGRFRVQSSGDTDLVISDTSTNAVSGFLQVKTAGRLEYNCYKSGVGTKYPHVFVGYTEEYARIDTNGIKFNGDTAAANALDDYEEGTWTPAFTASAGSSATTNVNAASYTKVGNQVFVVCYIEVSSETGSDGGLWMVSGLPFTAKSNNHYFPISVGYWNNLEHSMTYLAGTVQPNETNILFRGVPSGTQSATTNLSYSTYSQQGAGVILSATYLVP